MTSLEDISLTNWVLIGSTITALYKYITYNEGVDKLELDLDLKMIDTSLLEIKVKIENKGKVRAKIQMKDFTYKVEFHEDSSAFSANTENSLLPQSDNKKNVIVPLPILRSKEKDDYTWINGFFSSAFTDSA